MDMHLDTRAELNPFDGLAPSLVYFSPPARSAPLAPAARPDSSPKLGEAACEDVPRAIGHMIVVSYAAILVAFGLAFSGASDVLFTIGVCAVYLAAYLGAPWVMFRVEARHRPHGDRRLADFLENGLETWTGHVSGSAALAQILTIPIALTLAVCGIGVILRLSI